MDITIRRGTLDDARGIVDVVNSIIEEGGLTSIYPALTLQRGEALVKGLDPRSAIFVAEVSGAILGVGTIEPFARYTRAMDHVAVTRTFVYRNFRRRGVGHQLIKAMLDLARREGYEKLIIHVRIGNSGAQAFYRAMGFIPKLMLERQVKIEGKYDDEILMEMFVSPEEEPAAREARPQVAAPPAPEKVVEAPSAAAAERARARQREVAPAPEPVVAVDPTVGAVTVRRAKRRDLRTLAAIMKGTMRWRSPPTEEEVLDMLFDKGYWLAMSRKGGGVTGWRAENLVMCIDDFYVYPSQYHAQVGGPLLETVETEAKALSCEVAIAFLDKRIAAEAIRFFEANGYERQELKELFSVWREVAQEFLSENRFMMVKKLREKRIMRPL